MFFFILLQFVSSLIGEEQCASMITQKSCEQLGYCYWSSQQCWNEDCYKVKEIAACRQGGVLSTICQPIEMTPQYYLSYGNVCNEITDAANELISYLIRYQQATFGYADKSLSEYTLKKFNSKFPLPDFKKEIYTIQILKQNITQFDQTLDIFLNYQQLIFEEANQYISISHEVTITQILQMLRDDMTLLQIQKIVMLEKVWKIIDYYLERQRISLTNYTVYYPVFTISQSALYLQKVNLTGHQYKVQFSWDKQQQDGYVQIFGYDLNQFGIIDTLTQVYEFNVYDYEHNSQNITYSIQYIFTFDATTTPIFYASYDRTTMSISNLTSLSCIYDSTTTYSTICKIPVATSNTKYFVTHSIQKCTSIIKRWKCKQPTCRWDDDLQACQIS